MGSEIFCCYEFGEFRLDARRRALSKNGETLPLSARNFELLLFMVENGGRLLEHDELLDKVWKDTFVEQTTLQKGISALRQILAENAEDEFIKTIPRRGYSFTSPVRVVPEENRNFVFKETEQQIIIEEYVETDDSSADWQDAKRRVEVSPENSKRLSTVGPKKFNSIYLAGFAGLGMVVLILAFLGLKPFFASSVVPRFSIENVRVKRITNSGKISAGTAVSADGNYFLYTMNEKDGNVLWIRQADANSTSKLTPPLNGYFWSMGIAPDNRYVYYIFNDPAEPAKSGLFKVPLLGGEAERLTENVSTLAVSPDSKRVALIRIDHGTRLFTVNTNGEDERTVATFPENVGLWGISWTPDGTALLCTIRETDGEKKSYHLSEISLENVRERVILPAQNKILSNATWLPDKEAVLVTVREANAEIGQIWQYFPGSEQWRRVTNDNNSYGSVMLTRDGQTIVASQLSRLSAIWLFNSSGRNTTANNRLPLIGRDEFQQITDGISYFDKLVWLTENRLVYSATENGRETLFTINENGTNPRPVTTGEDGTWIFPKTSANGRNICFISARTGMKQAWRVNFDGKNLVKLTSSATPVFEARVLRDDSTVFYTTQIISGVTVLLKQSPDGQITQLTDLDTGSWAISPDEKFLALELIDKATHKYHTELRALEDGKLLKTFDWTSFRQIIFTPDGKNLAYDVKPAESGQIMIQPLDGGESYPLTNFQTDDIFSFDWSPDGTRLALIRGKQLVDAVQIKANNR